MAAPARLETDEVFPTVTAPVADDGEMTLPDDLEGSWALVVFYRGHW